MMNRNLIPIICYIILNTIYFQILSLRSLEKKHYQKSPHVTTAIQYVRKTFTNPTTSKTMPAFSAGYQQCIGMQG